MEIQFYANDKLVSLLKEKDIELKDYRPAYGGESVGLDLYYAGDEKLSISTGKELIPTGVHLALPKGYVAFIKERGSIVKTLNIKRAGVIDPGYTGEVFVNLIGTNDFDPGDKLPVQIVVVKAETEFKPVTKEDFDELVKNSLRGEGKTGSSD